MTSNMQLAISKLSPHAQISHILPTIVNILLAVCELTDAGCCATSHQHGCKGGYSNKIVLQGWRPNKQIMSCPPKWTTMPIMLSHPDQTCHQAPSVMSTLNPPNMPYGDTMQPKYVTLAPTLGATKSLLKTPEPFKHQMMSHFTTVPYPYPQYLMLTTFNM